MNPEYISLVWWLNTMFTEPEIIGIVLGIVGIVLATIAIFIPFLIERLKRPHLIVRIENEIHVVGQPIRFLHGIVINQPHLDFLRWIDRYPAYDCRVVLSYAFCRISSTRYLSQPEHRTCNYYTIRWNVTWPDPMPGILTALVRCSWLARTIYSYLIQHQRYIAGRAVA